MTDHDPVRGAAELLADAHSDGKTPRRYDGLEVRYEGEGRSRKLVLPTMPAHDATTGQCAWIACAFNLDPRHPIAGGDLHGPRGRNGLVVLYRAGAPDLRFEPAGNLNTPGKLIEELSWQMIPTDGPIHALGGEHCRQISHVVRMLCGSSRSLTAREETARIVATFLQAGKLAVGEHTTYGKGPQSYQAVVALRRDGDDERGPRGPARYFVEPNTGEHVIRVVDLAEVARRLAGGLKYGWLDARMEELGWRRLTLDGHEQSGRVGRRGPHACAAVYRGRWEPPNAVTR